MAAIDFSLKNRNPDGNGKLLVGDLSPTDGSYTTESQYKTWIQQDIIDGTVTAKKAECDQNGNVIDTTYETKAEANDLKNAIDANSKRITNLEQKAGDEIVVDYPSSTYGMDEVPASVAEYAKVSKLRGVSRVDNQLFDISETPTGTSNGITNTGSGQTITFSGTASDSYLRFLQNAKSIPNHTVLVYNAGTIDGYATVVINGATQYKVVYAHDGLILNNCDSVRFYAQASSGATLSGTIIPIIRDLTLYFSSEPSVDVSTLTISDIQTNYPELLIPSDYDTGTIVSTTYSGVKSRGVNWWNEEWELGTISNGADAGSSNSIRTKGYTEVDGRYQYYLNFGKWNNVFCYDENKTYIGIATYVASGSGYALTLVDGTKYVRWAFTSNYGATYNNDVQLALNSSSAKETYHHHVAPSTLSLPTPITLRSAGSVADTCEPNVEVNGVEKRRQTTRIGTYTFTGNETWTTYSGNSKRTDIVGLGAKDIGASVIPNVINDMGLTAVARQSIASVGEISVSSTTIIISNDSVALATAGKKINFELDSYDETLLDPILDPFLKVEGGGTIRPIQTQTTQIDSSMSVDYLGV